LAVLVRLPAAPVLLCGNLAWTKEQYVHARLPGLLADRQAWWEKIWRLKKFAELAPELVVLPGHEWATVETAKNKDIILHPFSAKEAVETAVKEPSENKKKKEGQSKRRQKQTAQKKKKA
jgi:glyoxylase-like metal-dependent hydrolase (beta-lactamase superfamily II)